MVDTAFAPPGSSSTSAMTVQGDPSGRCIPISSTGVGSTTEVFNSTSKWYNPTGSLLLRIGLLIAGVIGAGSHTYTYNSDNTLATDAWTILGYTKTKTFTWTAGLITAESDWV